MARNRPEIWAVLLVCLPLLSLHSAFYVDWVNHQWEVGYYGAYFRNHFSFPNVLNATEHAGIAYPIFYGFLFYPLLGFFAALFNAAYVLRVAIFLALFWQFLSVNGTLKKLGAPSALSTAVSCLVTWAVYPLTNLYARGALTEFFSTLLIVCALCTLCDLFLCTQPPTRTRKARSFGLSFTLAAGMHPITGLYGSAFLAISFLFFANSFGGKKAGQVLKSVALPLLTSAIVLLPWYLESRAFQPELGISSSFQNLVTYSNDIDWWVSRISPLPFDLRMFHQTPDQVSTPYLEAPINVPLVVLALGVLWSLKNSAAPFSKKNWITVTGIFLLFFFTLLLSVNFHFFRFLPGVAKSIQFLYRVVTYVNLSVLLGIFLFIGMKPGKAFQPPRWLIASCMAISILGLAIKEVHSSANVIKLDRAPVFLTQSAQKDLLHIPSQFYGRGGYATSARFSPLTESEQKKSKSGPFDMGFGAEFGLPQAKTWENTEETWAITQIQAFAWNGFLLDENPVPHEDLRLGPDLELAVRVPPGRHVLKYAFNPDRPWLSLKCLSLVIASLWILLSVAENLRNRLSGHEL